ncbi:MAG: GrpB family protein [Candidatus Bathyarchaeota archaeon]|nr:GrpB family protein [Candidatus Bathyarchaeota archaeon]
MNKTIRIADYDPQWAVLYEEEKRRILEVVGYVIVGVEHIGSTAVPNLGAKPIIDIIVAVSQLNDAERCIVPLRSIGCEYVPEHEDSIPERRYFYKGHPPMEQHYHLHMVEQTSNFWKNRLLFRDYLCTHPKDAQEYYELKKDWPLSLVQTTRPIPRRKCLLFNLYSPRQSQNKENNISLGKVY